MGFIGDFLGDIFSPDVPVAPDVGTTTREAIKTELEFAPQFSEQALKDLFKFAEAFKDIQLGEGADIARGERALQKELFPEEVAVERQLGRRLAGELRREPEDVLAGLGELDISDLEAGAIPEDIESAITERFRAEEAQFGRLGAPVGSINVARQLGLTGEEIRRQRVAERLGLRQQKVSELLGGRGLQLAEEGQTLGQALSFAGRVPFAASPTQIPIAQPQFQQGALTGQQLGLTGSIFGTQTGAATTRRRQNIDFLGDIAGVGAAFI